MDGTDGMNDKTDFFPGDLETVDADLADRMDENSTRLAARMADIRSRYLATRRDRDVDTELKLLIGNASVSVDGHQDERRCLAMMGETGAGKTTLIKRSIAAREEFRPRITGMTETAPITPIQAPRPSSLLLVAYEILEALDYPLERNLKPAAAWKLVRRQLKTRKVRFLHIDEAQHMLNMRDHEAMQELSDALKMVMEDAAWPVSLILTGLPELGDFLSIYRQIARRSHKVHLKNLVFPKDAEMISWMVRTIVGEHARMTFAFEWDESFLARLSHAANRQFGALTQIVRVAVERALIEDIEATEVRKDHFVQSYSVFSGCQPDENIISARSWEGIEPMNALLRQQEANYLRLLQALAERDRELRDRRLGRKKKDAN